MFDEHVTGQKTKKGPLQVIINTINRFKENHGNYGVRAQHKAYNEMLQASHAKDSQLSKTDQQEEAQEEEQDQRQRSYKGVSASRYIHDQIRSKWLKTRNLGLNIEAG